MSIRRATNPLVYICLVFFCCSCSTFTRRRSLTVSNEDGSRRYADTIIIQTPSAHLPSSEVLTYRVKWLGIPVGIITASIKGTREIRGRQAYVLEINARSNAFCSRIYRVADRFISYVDVENFYTLRHEAYRREGRYRKEAVTDFDQEKHKAYFFNLVDNTKKEFDIPERVQDPLSACYYFMTLPVQAKDTIAYAVCNNEEIYDVFCQISSPFFITVPGLGESESFSIQPQATLKNKPVKKGRATVYFNCARRRTPLFAVIRAPVFTRITVTLLKSESEVNAP